MCTNDTNLTSHIEKLGYKQELKRTLTFKSLLVFGLAYIAPTAVMSYMGLITEMTHGMLALGFIIATIAMSFTAFSYAKMSAVFPIAGSAYSYSQRTINPFVGFMTGWIILLDYVLLPIVSYVLLGLYANVLIPEAPAWVFVIIAGLILSTINYRGVDIMAKVNNVLIVIIIIFMVAFFLFMVKFIATGNGAATFFSPAAIINTQELSVIGWGTIFTGASVLVLCFLGIDAVTTLAEEAINPEKNIGKAIITVTLGVGIYFIVYAYFMQLSWPNGWFEFETADTAAAEMVEHVAGSFVAYLFTAIYVLSCVAGVLAIQTSGTRILYGMGRDGIFPKKFFGYVHPKYKTPSRNVIFTSILSVGVAITVDLLSISSVVNFGALLGFTMVNISVIAHYFVQEKRRKCLRDVLRYLVAPSIGAIICIVIWFSLDSTALILGGCWTAIGFIYLVIMTKGFKQLPKEMTFNEKQLD